MPDIHSAIRRPSRGRALVGALLLLAALTACSTSADQVSFIGPTIEGVRQFQVVRANGQGRTSLFSGVPGLGPYLEWSPDGKRAIVFKSDDKTLYLADPSSGEFLACLSCELDRAGVAAFSPGGDLVAIGDRQGIALVKTHGSGSRRISAVASPDWLGWAPDGNRLAFSAAEKQWRIFIVPVSEGGYIRLSDDVVGDAFAPQWSPKGDSIAFHLLDADGLHLMVMSPEGTQARKVSDWKTPEEVFDPGLAWPPQWSPSGEKIAFASLGLSGQSDIFVVNADGTGLINLTNSPGQDLEPVWSPDGSSIAFVSYREGNAEIFVMRADGSDPINVSSLPQTDEFQPAWRP